MSIKLKLITVIIVVFILFIITAILISIDILDRAVDSGESTQQKEVLELSIECIKKLRQGEHLSPESLDTFESSIVAAMSNAKQRVLFRDDLLKRLILLLIFNAIPYVIIAYFALVFVVSKVVAPIRKLTKDIKKYPDITTEMLTTTANTDKEVRELTEQFKVMLDNILDYQNKLEVRSKLDGWIEVSRAIIHEVGNAMAPAKDRVGQLTLEFPQNHNIAVVKKSIVRMDEIFQQMRQFYKSETIIRTNFDLFEELTFICEGYNVPFENGTNADSLIISAGKTECTQLIINLIKNAINATSETEKPVVKVSMKFIGDELVFTVSDNGCGIASDRIDHIFTPGYSTKSNNFGIGLAIVSKYITLHEWNINVISQPKRGSQFIVTIPKRDIYETISTAS
jgi:signal transduction histidine kinase